MKISGKGYESINAYAVDVVDAVAEPDILVATLVPDATISANPSPTAPQEEPPQNQTIRQPLVMPVTAGSDPYFSRCPMLHMTCPNCHQESRSKVRTFPVWQTWAAVGVVFFLAWPLCWMPLGMDSCKQSDHFCSSCGNKVGSVPAFKDCCVTTRG
jgi:hypothetical protein